MTDDLYIQNTSLIKLTDQQVFRRYELAIRDLNIDDIIASRKEWERRYPDIDFVEAFNRKWLART